MSPISSILLALFIIALPCKGTSHLKPTIYWCFDDLKGAHEFPLDPTHPIGPSVDLMRYLAANANFKLNLLPSSSHGRCLKLMEKGEADIMTNLVYTPERAKFMELYEMTTKSKDGLLLLANHSVELIDKRDFLSLKLTLIRGYKYGSQTETLLNHSTSVSQQFVTSIDAAVGMLKKQRTEAVLLPLISAYLIANNDSQLQVATLPHEIHSADSIYIGF